jgi:hypothetical protein
MRTESQPSSLLPRRAHIGKMVDDPGGLRPVTGGGSKGGDPQARLLPH